MPNEAGPPYGKGAWSRGVAQSGRAPALGAGGREFESRRPDHAAPGVRRFEKPQKPPRPADAPAQHRFRTSLMGGARAWRRGPRRVTSRTTTGLGSGMVRRTRIAAAWAVTAFGCHGARLLHLRNARSRGERDGFGGAVPRRRAGLGAGVRRSGFCMFSAMAEGHKTSGGWFPNRQSLQAPIACAAVATGAATRPRSSQQANVYAFAGASVTADASPARTFPRA